LQVEVARPSTLIQDDARSVFGLRMIGGAEVSAEILVSISVSEGEVMRSFSSLANRIPRKLEDEGLPLGDNPS